MSAAAWAVVGVFVGAGLQALTNLWSERRVDKRAEAERVDRRDARLFDARRTAYEAFQSTARSLQEEVFRYHAELPNAVEPDYDFADPLVSAIGSVRLYGSATTVEAAEALLRVITEYGASDLADKPSDEAVGEAYEHASEAITTFAAAARVELGG